MRVFRLCLCALLAQSVAFCEWIMFSDSKDTYIYNNQSGEIFIRHKMGGENYEDLFVRMPRGAYSNEVRKDSKISSVYSPKNPQVDKAEKDDKELEQRKLDALKKSQEVLNNALEF